MVRGLMLTALAASLVLSSGAAAGEPGGPSQPIDLRIENHSRQAIRCVAVLAHFVTRDLAPIAPGASLRTTLLREPATGTLAYGSHAAVPMMIENLLCGTVAAWTDSYSDAPLLAIRSDPDVVFQVACDDGPRLRCVLETAHD